MVDTNQTVVFSRSGVTVEEERETPLSDGARSVTVDELDWDEFAIENLTMEVDSIEPVPSDDDETLSELRFDVTRLSRSAEPTQSSSDDFWQQVEEKTRITYEDDEVALNGDVSAKANLVSFVEFLFENGYLRVEDLPVKSGWKRHLINTERVHRDGESMSQAEPVAGGNAYLETKHSRSAIKEKIDKLADEFGE